MYPVPSFSAILTLFDSDICFNIRIAGYVYRWYDNISQKTVEQFHDRCRSSDMPSLYPTVSISPDTCRLVDRFSTILSFKPAALRLNHESILQVIIVRFTVMRIISWMNPFFI